MISTTQAIFDATASTYDNDSAKLIPNQERFYGWTTALIPDDATRIVELGAGSGKLTAMIRHRFPMARIHVVDFSEPMLQVAKARLGEHPTLSYECGDFTKIPLWQSLDAVVSSLAIHYIENPAKQSLFQKIYTSLKLGGVFINADQVAGQTPDSDARSKQIWLAQARANGTTAHQIADSLYRQEEVRCATVEEQIAWMRRAGFADAECWFKDNRFAVIAASKAI